MKFTVLKRVSYVVFIVVLLKMRNSYFMVDRLEKNDTVINESQKFTEIKPIQERIPLCLVICRDRGDVAPLNSRDMRLSWRRQKEQFLVVFASLLYFSKLPSVKVFLFTDSLETYLELLSSLDKWPQNQRRRLQFEMHDVEIERLPRNQITQWRPCAWSKMYIPEMLPDIDAVVYIDSDAVFLGPAEDLWQIFHDMHKDVSIAAAAEMWYVEEGNKWPAAGKFGINTGVMLMNLTRLRKFQLAKNLMEYSMNMVPPPRHDQDALNALLKDYPQLLHEVSARYNFSPSSCQRSAPTCRDCLGKGILVLHGSDSTFFKLVDAKMKAIYQVLQNASLDLSTTLTELVQCMEAALLSVSGVSQRYEYICQHLPEYDRQIMGHPRSLVQSSS